MRGVFVGLATFDVVHRVDHMPTRDQKVSATWQSCLAGGPAANAARTYAVLGGEAVLLTVLGKSHIAKAITRDLLDYGVQVVDIAPDLKVEPPVASVIIEERSGTRAVVARERVPLPYTVPRRAFEYLHGADTLLTDGHHRDLSLAMVTAARESGIDVIVDGGRWKSIFSEILPLATVAIVSSDFGLVDLSEKAVTADLLLRLGMESLAVTRGSQPVRWWQHGGRTGKIQPPVVNAVDTLGAGDVLHGAFCYYRTQYQDFPDQLEAAVRIASDRCQFRGMHEWLDTVREAGSR